MTRLASQTTGPCRRPTLTARALLPLALVLAGLALVAGCGGSDTNVNFPNQPEPPTMPWFFDVFGTAANNVYVAGESGVMYHWDGTAWAPVDLGTSSAVTTIWGPGDGTLYLCGHDGLIMRNTGSGWTRMDSGTTNDLYGLGSYQGTVHVAGYEGVLKRLTGGSWANVPATAVIRNPQAGDAATDTLSLTTDVASLLTINHYFIGGAYRLPGWLPADQGRKNTDGMVLTADNPPVGLPAFDWQLRPLRGDELAESEWVYCTTSDDVTLANNFLGTSEGWLFQLLEDEDNPGRLVWSKYNVRITGDRNTGIRDMWLNTNGDLYMVTDGGRIAYRSAAGEIRVLYDQQNSLVGIWGASASEFYVTGYMDEMILRCSYDPGTDTFTSTPVLLAFPE